MTPKELKAQRRRIYNRRWRAKHHAELLVKEQAWRDARRDELRARSKAWRLSHLDKSKACGKASYAAKRDELVAKKRAYNAARRDEINAKCRAYEALHRDQKLARGEAYRRANRDTLRVKNREYARTHRAAVSAKAMKRLAAQHLAAPPWANLEAIKAFYNEAARLTRETGIKHHVDHIVPLRGRTVCGLHVAINLRVITESENCQKSNKFPVNIAS